MLLPGQGHIMTEKDAWVSYLPAVWIQKLSEIPILGHKFELISLDKRFIEFLESDGLILDDITAGSSFSSSEDDTIEELDDSETVLTPSSLFPDIDSKIKLAVSNFSTGAVPKLNWTVPKDSVWISANTLKCTSANEIYQLLKASDRIQSDLILSQQLGVEPVLFIRQFIEVEREFEFRVFVKNNIVLAICQRNMDVFNPNLGIKSQKIIRLISSFFLKYFVNFPLPNYLIDVYVCPNTNEVSLVDINPVSESCFNKLFTYDDYNNTSSKNLDDILFKCILTNDDTIIGMCERNFLPIDLLNANSDIGKIDFNNL